MLALVILDGFGLAAPSKGNAISLAHTPNLDALFAESLTSELQASGSAVGLPEGQMGNSEVGHLTIGSGRILAQDLVRINHAFAANQLSNNHNWRRLIASNKQDAKVVHLIGLMSNGGVHSELDHILYLARQLSGRSLKVKLHLFTDGRDTAPRSALKYLSEVESLIACTPSVSIATITGRYYAMDRDQRWERTSQAYYAIASGEGARVTSFSEAIEACYKEGVTDEFVKPLVASGYSGFREAESILVANFRADRMRQLLQSFVLPEFNHFDRGERIKAAMVAGLVSYGEMLDKHMVSIFPPQKVRQTLGELASQAGLKQLRLAETEKYAHVTYFLDGEVETSWPGCEKVLVPSPKVATYDQAPAMSAPAITELLTSQINARLYDLIVVNYANADMIGHTGDVKATIKAIEVLDKALGRLSSACKANGVDMVVTADHGNAECMLDADGNPVTAHSCNPVPLLISSQRYTPAEFRLKHGGGLADIAPTVLEMLGIKIPREMTGENLLVRK